jgi:hypothetical protein
MRPRLWAAILGAAITATAAPARAQYVGGMGTYGASAYYGLGSIYGAPGYYGMMVGYPGWGYPRTYTSFSSPYGAGYGYGYAPYSLATGRFGVGLWRPGFATPGYVYGAGFYRTFPVPFRPLGPNIGPPVGYYAPGFGPPAFYSW